MLRIGHPAKVQSARGCRRAALPPVSGIQYFTDPGFRLSATAHVYKCTHYITYHVMEKRIPFHIYTDQVPIPAHPDSGQPANRSS